MLSYSVAFYFWAVPPSKKVGEWGVLHCFWSQVLRTLVVPLRLNIGWIPLYSLYDKMSPFFPEMRHLSPF